MKFEIGRRLFENFRKLEDDGSKFSNIPIFGKKQMNEATNTAVQTSAIRFQVIPFKQRVDWGDFRFFTIPTQVIYLLGAIDPCILYVNNTLMLSLDSRARSKCLQFAFGQLAFWSYFGFYP